MKELAEMKTNNALQNKKNEIDNLSDLISRSVSRVNDIIKCSSLVELSEKSSRSRQRYLRDRVS